MPTFPESSDVNAEDIYRTTTHNNLRADVLSNRTYIETHDDLVTPTDNPHNINSLITDVQVFNTVGSHTWTKPTGAKLVEIKMWGGGGRGSAVRSDSSTHRTNGAGGGGMYLNATILPDTLNATETVVVGAGGIGGDALPTGTEAFFGTGMVNAENTTFAGYTAYAGGDGSAGTSSNQTRWVGGAGGGFSQVTGENPRENTDQLGVIAPETGTLSDNPSRETGFFGLLAGGGGGWNDATSGKGGNSLYGGAGGGPCGSSSGHDGGTSVYGGNGGAGKCQEKAEDGAIPGGGGGASAGTLDDGVVQAGSGGRGEAIIITYF